MLNKDKKELYILLKYSDDGKKIVLAEKGPLKKKTAKNYAEKSMRCSTVLLNKCSSFYSLILQNAKQISIGKSLRINCQTTRSDMLLFSVNIKILNKPIKMTYCFCCGNKKFYSPVLPRFR